MIERLIPLLGIAAMIGIALAFSTDRKAALKRWDLIAWGFGLQFGLALIVLRTAPGRFLFDGFNDIFQAIINVTNEGSSFIFGSMMDVPSNGFIFAVQVLPTIIFFSALTAVLYHMGVLQKVVGWLAWLMQKTLKTSGAETLSASANIFVGQTEAPLMVRPFINKMTKSELMTVMTGGFATVAGGVLAAYVGLLDGKVDGIAGHLLAASIMSAPAALVFGKLFIPETEQPETADTIHVEVEKESVNFFDAAAVGTREGLALALNVGAMLLAFIALIALVDLILGTGGRCFLAWLDFFRMTFGYDPVHLAIDSEAGIIAGIQLPQWWNLRGISGYLFAPLAWLMGITNWSEAVIVGRLMGVKMIATEFVAYIDLSVILDQTTPEGAPLLSERARLIATYALCGFANFGSIGIQIGGLSIMAPERRPDLSRIAFRAMIAGTFACCATACVAGILL